MRIDTILEKYRYNEEFLRRLRNVLSHPKRSYDKGSGLWEEFFLNLKRGDKNKRISPDMDFSKVIKSEIGDIIFKGKHNSFEKIKMKETLDYGCLKKILNFIGVWLDDITKDISSYF